MTLDPRAVTAPAPDLRLRIHQATALRWKDGDTVEAAVVLADLAVKGRLVYEGPCRIAHIDAPERHGATKTAGDLATAHADTLWPAGQQRIVRINGLDKYGRPLLEVDLGSGDFLDFADAMIQAGAARAYEGGARA